MEQCSKCGISESDVRLFDAICDGRMEVICERCSIIENMPVIKKPNAIQLKEAESGVNVYDRMKMISGLRDDNEEDTFFPEDKLNELDHNPELELPEPEKFNLIEHFHWEIMKNRRRKGLSQKQLAETLGESEVVIQMIEKSRLPENAESVIRKLEQFFQVKLRKISETEKILKEEEQKPVLLDEEGEELDFIPESKVFCKVETKKDSETPLLDNQAVVECEIKKPEGVVEEIKLIDEEPLEIIEEDKKDEEFIEIEPEKPIEIEPEELEVDKDFEIKKTDLSQIKISDLKELHKKKVEATKQEMIEEQRKIEDRQRILEALREKDRIKQDQQIEHRKIEEQKAEQERQRLIEVRKEEFKLRKSKESSELDKMLGGEELLRKTSSDSSESEVLKKEDSDFEDFDKELV